MGIQISNAVTSPAITYDKIHVTKLEITQAVFDDDTAIPVYAVNISFRHYGIHNGVRYYAKEDVQTVAVNHFIALASQKAAQGDMSLLEALQGIETAVAGIISDQTGTSAAVV